MCLQLGGTVGDIESMPFIEAFRQFQFKVKRENFCNIHVSLIPQVRRTTFTFVIMETLGLILCSGSAQCNRRAEDQTNAEQRQGAERPGFVSRPGGSSSSLCVFVFPVWEIRGLTSVWSHQTNIAAMWPPALVGLSVADQSVGSRYV